MNYWSSLDNKLEDLRQQGFCFLPPIGNRIDRELLASTVIDQIQQRKQTLSVYTTGVQAHQSFRDEFGISDTLLPRLFEFAKNEYNYKGNISNQYHVARYVCPGHSTEAYRAHFDSHLFTLVVPITIPKKTATNTCIGELAFIPKARRSPKSELVNIYQKMYFKRYANARAFTQLQAQNRMQVESFSDDRPLLFQGMTTFHGNYPVTEDASSYRLTLLSHFFDPTPAYGIGNILRKLRRR